nr:zinc finger protein 64-like [Penaeus vannamei]
MLGPYRRKAVCVPSCPFRANQNSSLKRHMVTYTMMARVNQEKISTEELKSVGSCTNELAGKMPTNTESHMFVEEDATVPEKTYHPADILDHRHLYNRDSTSESLANRSKQAIEGQHMLLMPQPKPYSCKWCSFICSKRCDLKKHLRIHTGERPFKCHICPAQFIQNIHLKTTCIFTPEKSRILARCAPSVVPITAAFIGM